MNLHLRIEDDDTLCVTDDWITDYIRMTGDPDRPWFYLHGQMLPLTPLIRAEIDQFARFKITEQDRIDIDRWLAEQDVNYE